MSEHIGKPQWSAMSSYTKGCRCEDCTAAWVEYHNRYRDKKDPQRVKRRLRAQRQAEGAPLQAATDPDFWDKVKTAQYVRVKGRF